MAYLVTALALGLSYVATKFAVAKWWAKPPMVSEDMMEKMRARLGALMLLHTLISAMGANGASASVAGATSAYDLFNAGAESAGPVTAMLVLWIIYEVLDTPGLLARIPILRAYSEDTEGGDTNGCAPNPPPPPAHHRQPTTASPPPHQPTTTQSAIHQPSAAMRRSPAPCRRGGRVADAPQGAVLVCGGGDEVRDRRVHLPDGTRGRHTFECGADRPCVA
jgi:hypothetical protein